MSGSHTTIDYVAAYATAATALGTLILATATFLLARKTKDLAQSGQQTADAAEGELLQIRQQTEAAQKQGVAAEEALSVSVRPLLLDSPEEWPLKLWMRVLFRVLHIPVSMLPGPFRRARISSEIHGSRVNTLVTDEAALAFLTVRNVGAGLARIHAAVIAPAEGGIIGEPLASASTSPSVIAPADKNDITFMDESGALRKLLLSDRNAVIEIAYSDIANRQDAATIFYMSRLPGVNEYYLIDRVDPGRRRQLTAERV